MAKKYKFNGKVDTIICKGSVVGGAFSAPGSARIEGSVNGDITVKGMLILGSEAVVEGNIKAEAALIGGTVNGNVDAVGKVQLTSTAKVIGDILTDSIVIDEKAVFQGKCEMHNPVATPKEETAKPEEKAEEKKEEKTEE